MKVKQRPEDFRVEELIDVVPGTQGDFALYRLDKIGWTTPDALANVQRRWKIDARRLAFAGLKDRYADTTQFISIHRGPRRDFTHERIRLTHLGQIEVPFSSAHIRANRFTITLRHLTISDEAAARTAIDEIPETGVPNYFDDQRFGSVSDQEFIGREMVFGRFEQALRLALTAPYEHDRAEAKTEKATLRKHWGDWAQCSLKLRRGDARPLVNYLAANEGNFAGAVARLRPDLGGLYLAAYQSYLWNKMLDRWLREQFLGQKLGTIRLAVGDFAVPLRGSEEQLKQWSELTLPLPSARLKESSDVIDAVLADEGLTLPLLKVPGLEKPFFSKGDRVACLRPEGLSTAADDDDLNRGRRKLQLVFELPRGCYATMVIKRITSVQMPT